jgi:hypothetical protein
MKSASLIAILFAVATMQFPQITKAASDTTAFDGTWQVTMSARNYDNPNSTMSDAYAYHFSMIVKNGVLHGERGNRGMWDFYEIDGKIAADGTATLRADGITGAGTQFTKGHSPPGKPYTYAVSAQFKGRNGSGKSAGPRIRIFTFVKE